MIRKILIKSINCLLIYFFSFFRCLCIASKIDETVEITKKALEQDKSVVIALQSTGEAQAVKNIDSALDFEISSTAYGILKDLFKKLPNPKDSNLLNDQDQKCLSNSLEEIHSKMKKIKKSLPKFKN